jgi:hypothetical protein
MKLEKQKFGVFSVHASLATFENASIHAEPMALALLAATAAPSHTSRRL